jgi:hypothetical protein
MLRLLGLIVELGGIFDARQRNQYLCTHRANMLVVRRVLISMDGQKDDSSRLPNSYYSAAKLNVGSQRS